MKNASDKSSNEDINKAMQQCCSISKKDMTVINIDTNPLSQSTGKDDTPEYS